MQAPRTFPPSQTSKVPGGALLLRASQLCRGAFLVAMGAGAFFIARASLPYFVGSQAHPFILEKLPLAHPTLWLSALYVHIPAALFSLPACLALSTRYLVQKLPRVHRLLGRATGAVVLLGVVPSGTVLAFSAKGGALGAMGFLLSGSIVAAAMIRGIVHARARRFAAHRECVIHVTAQLSVAVTSRVLLFVLDRGALDSERVYLLALWMTVLASAFVAECIATVLRPPQAPARGPLSNLIPLEGGTPR